MKKAETVLGQTVSFWLSYVSGILIGDWLGSILKMEDGVEKNIIFFPTIYGFYFIWRFIIGCIEDKFGRKKLLKFQKLKTTTGKFFAFFLSLISTIIIAVVIGKYANEWHYEQYGYPMKGDNQMYACLLLFLTFWGIWSIVIVWIEYEFWKRKVKNRPNNRRKM